MSKLLSNWKKILVIIMFVILIINTIIKLLAFKPFHNQMRSIITYSVFSKDELEKAKNEKIENKEVKLVLDPNTNKYVIKK